MGSTNISALNERGRAMTTRLFDTDQHITMPPDTWVSRMPKKFQDQAPHVEDTDEGDQVWVVGQSVRYFGLENCAGTCAADYKLADAL